MAVNDKQFSCGLMPTIVLLVAAIFVFLPNVSSQFLLDDNILIKNNPFIRQLASPSDYLAQEDGILDRDNWSSDFHTRYYRPLINLTYHIDYRLWGLNPTGFHFTNWLLHLITSLLLHQILLRLTGNAWGAFIAALVFTVHPVQTEAVSWISSRNNILAALFSLASFLCYISARRRRYGAYLSLAVCFYCLAVFSKEFGVMLLPILFIYDRLFHKRPFIPDKHWLAYVPFVLILCLYLLARSQVTGALLDAPAGVPFGQRLLFAPYLILYNLYLIFLPVGLHNFLVTYPAEQMAIPITAGWLGMGLLGSLLWRCRHDRYVVFGGLSFLCGLFPVLNLVPTSAVTLVAMRWLYFPLAFLAFALSRMFSTRPGRYQAGLLLAIAICLGVYSFHLNREHWHDEERFFTREVLKFNNHLYAGAYARILSARGQSELAEQYYQLGIGAFPSLVENYLDYAALLIDLNRPHHALAVLNRCMGFRMSKENQGIAYNNKGMALFRLGRYRAAVAAFEEAVAYAPREAEFRSHLGGAYGMVSEYEKSVAALWEGLALDPDAVGIRRNLANSYVKMGEYQNAVRVLEAIPLAEREKDPGIERLLRRYRSYPSD
jgi:Tfp pilus assembly protein PilF